LHLNEFTELFVQVVRLAREMGLVKLGTIAVDGTKIKANASRHKSISYKRTKEEEARLEAEVKELLQKAEVVDEDEDRRYGKDRRGDELPGELAFRESRLRKIREAREALEAEVRQEAEQAGEEGKKAAGIPTDKAQRNFTDPDSHIMPAPGGKHFEQAYNAQAVVDNAHQVIVAAGITNEPTDRKQAAPMIEQVKANTGKLPRQMSADAGYFSKEVVQSLTSDGIDVYMPPDRMKHSSRLPEAPRGRIPKGLSVADWMRRKLKTKKGRRCYGLRKELSEPVFGQIKKGRGFR
jgi:hypothetical protein